MSGSLLLDNSSDLDPRQREQLVMIRRATEQMKRLVDDLLEVSSIEAGQLKIHAQRQQVEPMLRTACRLLDHAARAKTVKLDCNVRPDLPPVRADYNRILQVLGNLLDNAVKFSAAGGEVWLRAEADLGVVRFSVADTGPGIASEELPHVMTRRPVQRKVRRRLRSRVPSCA